MRVQAMNGYEGSHDTVDCDLIAGWAWDATHPDTPVAVDICDGKTLLGTAVADQFRQWMLGTGYGNGNHGFVAATPPELKDGRPHSITATISGTNITLLHTPKVVTCLPP
jgi:hypothetical protein